MAFVSDGPVPVTIVTGYLGSGKTTLLNNILTGDHGRRIAVIQNEFGEIGIDNDLVVQVDEDIYEMNNGCLCCTVRDDLVRVMEDLMERRAAFDHVIVETTGLAAPGPVVMTFLTHPDSQESFRVDGVVTVVDSLHLPLHLERSPESRQQIAYADMILVNKTDLVDADRLAGLERRIRGINPLAVMRRTTGSAVDPYDLLELGGFDLSRARELSGGEEDHDHAHGHDHEHEDDISSVGVLLDGEIDLRKLDAWLGLLTSLNHENIYRFKGIANLRGESRRFVVQGVHALFSGQFGVEWGQSPRASRFVFIGRGLDRAMLSEGLAACRAD